MVAAEIRRENITLRIHDSFCEEPSQGSICRLGELVAGAHRRRAREGEDQNRAKAEPQ